MGTRDYDTLDIAKMTKYIYKAEVEIYGAKHLLKLNDIPFTWDMLGQPETSEIPLNQLIIDGVNKLSLEVFPLDDNSELNELAEAKLIVKRFSYPIEPENFFVEHVYQLKAGELTGQSNKMHQAQFNAVATFERHYWEQALPFDFTQKEIAMSLFQEFERIWGLFHSKDTASILALYNRKFQDFESCYYLSEGDRTLSARNKLETVFEDSNYELGPFDKTFFNPLIVGNGRLITLVDNLQNHYNYINYYNSDRQELIEFPVYIGFDSKNEIRVFL